VTGNPQALEAAREIFRRTSPLLNDHSKLPISQPGARRLVPVP
jgi:hypothetical protein